MADLRDEYRKSLVGMEERLAHLGNQIEIAHQHELAFVVTAFHFHPQCKCGWKGARKVFLGRATASYFDHLREEGLEV